jgi:hypothetical protein
MHYLTQYYKNRCSQLQEQINFLNNRIQWLAEAAGGPTVGGGFSVGGSAEANEYGAAGSAGGSAPTGGQYSGAVLGNLLAAGDMSAVYQYLAQFYGNNPAAMSAIMASLGVNAPAGAEAAGPMANRPQAAGFAGGSAPTTGGAFSGAQLGQLLGAGNMAAVNQYLSQFGPQSAGPSAPTGLTRRRR